jgi:hypothetical protein
MSKNEGFLKDKLGGISAKTLSLGAKQFMRSRNEQKVGAAPSIDWLDSARTLNSGYQCILTLCRSNFRRSIAIHH